MTCKKDPDDDDPQSQNQSGASAPVPLLTCAPVQLSMQTCAPSGIRLGQAQVFVRKACVCCCGVGWGVGSGRADVFVEPSKRCDIRMLTNARSGPSPYFLSSLSVQMQGVTNVSQQTPLGCFMSPLTCPRPVTLPTANVPQVCCALAAGPVTKDLNTALKRRSTLSCTMR